MKRRLSTFFRRRYVSERHEHGRARYLPAKTGPEGSKELQSGATEKALVVDSVCSVWDIRTKMQIFALSGHDNDSCSVFTRATDPQVVTGSHDSTIKFWDLRYGRTMTTLTHHKKAVRAMALHPKENAFVSVSPDNTKKFSLPKGEFCYNMLSQQRATINAVAVNEDGVLVTGDSLTQSLLFLEEIKSFGKVSEAVGLFNERKNQGINSVLGMLKGGMTVDAVLAYENIEERYRKLKEHSLSFDEKMIDSVVKVFSATTRHDSYRPWQNREILEGSGSGFAISGKRILTCAHVVDVVNPCTFIDVQRNNSTIIYKARVTKISHESDLAVLEVANEHTFP